jgi:flagellar biosynthesis protein FlhA
MDIKADSPSMLVNVFNKLSKNTDKALAIGIMSILLVLIIPIPTIILDILLALSVSIAVIILMTTLFISRPLELSSFPTLLLITTLLRLSLNIASTRLILSKGHMGTSAAGHVIEAFGGFVMQGSVTIGLIVFIILTIINFIVITKGSGRIAEVAARFSLDAMPGKQMAIDADLSAGLIDEETAKTRRKQIEDESTFFGAMDGANKFVRGDAIAGILITMINLIGGIIIGVIERNLTFSKAVHTYTTLTIGDGLVSQIPALVISLAAGLLVSKSGVSGSADKAIFGQIGKYPQSLWMTSFITCMFGIMPGLPFVPFASLSFASFIIGYYIKLQAEEVTKKAHSDGMSPASSVLGDKISTKISEPLKEETMSEVLQLDIIKVELGYNLLSLLNYTKGSKLPDQIKILRKQLAKDYGFVIPSVRIADNLQLGQNEYVIKIKEIECAKGSVRADKLMVIDPKGETINIQGEETVEPTFGLPAKWIDERFKEEAMFNDYTVVDPPTVITTHLTEKIKDNITELLSYTEVSKLIEETSQNYSKLVKDVIPDQLTISTLQKVLQGLLAEMVSIRDLASIIEASADGIKISPNLNDIIEHVRAKLARQITYSNVDKDSVLNIITLSYDIENSFRENISGGGADKYLSMPPSQMQDFIIKFRKIFDQIALKGIIPVLVVSEDIRPYVKSVLDRAKVFVSVMSQAEIFIKVKVKSLGSVV